MIHETQKPIRESIRKFFLPITVFLMLGIVPEGRTQTRMDYEKFVRTFNTQESFRKNILYAITGGYEVNLNDPASIQAAIDSLIRTMKRAKNLDQTLTPADKEAILRCNFVLRFLCDKQLQLQSEQVAQSANPDTISAKPNETFSRTGEGYTDDEERAFQKTLSDRLNDPEIQLLVDHLVEFSKSPYFFIKPEPTKALELIKFLKTRNRDPNQVKINDSSIQGSLELETTQAQIKRRARSPDDSELKKMPSGIFHPFKTKKGIVWIKKVGRTRLLELSAFVLEHTFYKKTQRVIFPSPVDNRYPYQLLQNHIKKLEEELEKEKRREETTPKSTPTNTDTTQIHATQPATQTSPADTSKATHESLANPDSLDISAEAQRFLTDNGIVLNSTKIQFPKHSNTWGELLKTYSKELEKWYGEVGRVTKVSASLDSTNNRWRPLLVTLTITITTGTTKDQKSYQKTVQFEIAENGELAIKEPPENTKLIRYTSDDTFDNLKSKGITISVGRLKRKRNGAREQTFRFSVPKNMQYLLVKYNNNVITIQVVGGNGNTISTSYFDLTQNTMTRRLPSDKTKQSRSEKQAIENQRI